MGSIVVHLLVFFVHSWYLTLVQFLLYSAFARVDMARRGETRRIPAASYCVLSVTTLVAMGFSNASLGYLNYPTQVKDCIVQDVPTIADRIKVGVFSLKGQEQKKSTMSVVIGSTRQSEYSPCPIMMTSI